VLADTRRIAYHSAHAQHIPDVAVRGRLSDG
jgi:hypothetical protein